MIGKTLSICVFFLITLGLGHSVLVLAKSARQKNIILSLVETMAVGLATFSFLGVVLKVLHIPLHVSVYIVLAALVPLISLFKKMKNPPKPTWKKEETICAIILIIILALFLSLYVRGANVYPYLENDDPWSHAQSATYIAREHTYNIDPDTRELAGGYVFYLEPYPPTYDVLMGIMRQTNESVVWTLKFFNALMITLGLAFFYIFAKVYLNSDLKALLGTIALACLPSFMSHFIWSQTIAIVVFIAAMYAVVKALSDKTWRIPAIILVASSLVTQPVVSFVFGVVVLLLVFIVFLHEKSKKKKLSLKNLPMTTNGFIVGAGGLALSFVYWGAQFLKWGFSGIWGIKGTHITGGWGGEYSRQVYTISQILFPPSSSKIDQAIGVGLVLAIGVAVSMVIIITLYKKTLSLKKGWMHIHLLVWFVLLSYSLFSPTLGLPSWGSVRFWAYLSIPLCLLFAEGMFILTKSIAGKKYHLTLIILSLIAIGVIFTSLPPKIAVQTSQWPPGAHWAVPQAEIPGYLAMQQSLPKNSRVFPLCAGDERAIGFDMQSDPWDLELQKFRKKIPNVTMDELTAFLEIKQFEYVTLDATCVRNYGENSTVVFAQQLTDAQRFQPVISQPGFLLAKFI